ncbi:energy transducer TonB [Sphingomonas sabuli]|uniref:Energy transducer TonB n=1 Tax=Sphingomonas sabuli TaxID=2764186 RepID=A0A7G9L3N7_9SPHN|nr:energy transducer TonB [Sphingomonas sabuli]QNM83236.1 energy transducer TonB [Sphingomonas sabuli]
MADDRHIDPRSPVQRDKFSFLKVAFVGVLALIALVTVKHSWFDTFTAPQDTPAPTEPAGPSQQPARQTPPASDGGAQPAQGNLTALFSAADYPADAFRNDEQGTVMARLEIDPQGKVSSCRVATSSGSESLDRATCTILKRRARFTPARNSEGSAIASSYTQKITWMLQ